LDRAYQQTPELEPPLPRWAGLEHRKQQDAVGRFEMLRRGKRLTPAEQAEFDRLNQERTITPPVATVRKEVV
jgi:hypothetical protein